MLCCCCLFCAVLLYHSDEMDDALMTFVNCLGAVIMVSLVGFHYLTASAKDADN